jgi:mannose-6-phosphate isomerase-like protein (cupin superfamily)/ribosomal protein S18 acetylase RimI-like enzyme
MSSVPDLVFDVSDAPSPDGVRVVDAGLDDYNHAAAPLRDVSPVSVLAAERSGNVVGGALGRTWGLCCELLQLWVAAEYRRKGVGSRLLTEFEQHARARGCSVFYLTTLSFQAPAFYRKRGYGVLAEIRGYPGGIVKYLMQKMARPDAVEDSGASGKPAVLRAADTPEVATEERCFIRELSNSVRDESVSVAQARVAAGVTTRWHRLQGIAERYVILRGRGRVEVEGLDAKPVSAGDVVLIPPGHAQRIANEGSDDLVFLAICSPRFQPGAYVDAEGAEPAPRDVASHRKNAS